MIGTDGQSGNHRWSTREGGLRESSGRPTAGPTRGAHAGQCDDDDEQRKMERTQRAIGSLERNRTIDVIVL